LCVVMRWPAGLLYAPRGDEEAGGGPRERHIAADNTPPRNKPLLDDGLCDLGEGDGASAESCMQM
jgi:hypothetical protein